MGLFVVNYLRSIGLLAPHTVHTVSGFAGHQHGMLARCRSPGKDRQLAE